MCTLPSTLIRHNKHTCVLLIIKQPVNQVYHVYIIRYSMISYDVILVVYIQCHCCMCVIYIIETCMQMLYVWMNCVYQSCAWRNMHINFGFLRVHCNRYVLCINHSIRKHNAYYNIIHYTVYLYLYVGSVKPNTQRLVQMHILDAYF